MDIEMQLRENLVLHDPGKRFTDGVMSRVGDAPHGSRQGIVRLADERARRRNRRILLGVLVAGAAAAMLALLQDGGSDEAAVQITAVPQPAAVPAAAVIPSLAPAIEPPATAEPQPGAGPTAPPAGTFTVRVKPLANPGNLVAGVDLAQKLRDRLIARLRAIPNLVLVDPADDGTTDYEVRLRLENSPGIVQELLAETGAVMHTVLVHAGPPSRFAAMDARVAAEAGMSPADLQRSQRARQMASFRGRTTAILNNGMPMSVGLFDQPGSPSGGDMVDSRAADVVRTLRNAIFPVDAAFKQSIMATLRDPGVPFNQRLIAQSDLLRIESRDKYSTMDAEVIRAGADLALTLPDTGSRTIAWENMLATRHPELIPQIARALDMEPDTDIRLRLIKFLAGDLAGNAAARKVLEVAARANGQQLVRMAALREVQGDANWHAYVAASLVNASLPDLQRLQPIADMADPATARESARLALDDKALRELITLAGKVAGEPGVSTQAFNAILALKFVDNPALADRLIEIVRSPVNEKTPLTSVNTRNFKTAAIGVASVRFPADPRFPALLKELSASADAQLSAWAKEQSEMLEASTNPEARKALFEKMLQQIVPK